VPEWAVLSSEEVGRILERNGFAVARQRGSHVIYQRRLDGGTRTVPVPRAREIAIGTLRSICRQSGLPPALFQRES